MQEIMELGALLERVIDCPVHYPAFGKNLFECMCNRVFPVYLVRGAQAINDLDRLVKFHKEGAI